MYTRRIAPKEATKKQKLFPFRGFGACQIAEKDGIGKKACRLKSDASN